MEIRASGCCWPLLLVSAPISRISFSTLAASAFLAGLLLSAQLPAIAQAQQPFADSDLSPVVLRGQLSGHSIKVRAQPNVESLVVAQQPMGAVAQRLDQIRQSNGRIWGDLQFKDGSRGWVPLDYWRPVDRLAVAPESGAEPARWTGRLIPAELGDTIRVYEKPRIAEGPRYIAGLGDRVQIFDSEIGPEGYLWYYVSLPSFLQGWVRADQVQQVRDVLR